MNKFILVGYVGKEPEERSSASGVKMTIFSVAMNRFAKGEKQTSWVKCVVFGVNAFVEKYVHKGSLVAVTGTLNIPRVYTNKEGQPAVSLDMVVHHVEFGPGKKDEEKVPDATATPESSWDPKVEKILENRGPLTVAEPDDLPF